MRACGGNRAWQHGASAGLQGQRSSPTAPARPPRPAVYPPTHAPTHLQDIAGLGAADVNGACENVHAVAGAGLATHGGVLAIFSPLVDVLNARISSNHFVVVVACGGWQEPQIQISARAGQRCEVHSGSGGSRAAFVCGQLAGLPAW